MLQGFLLVGSLLDRERWPNRQWLPRAHVRRQLSLRHLHRERRRWNSRLATHVAKSLLSPCTFGRDRDRGCRSSQLVRFLKKLGVNASFLQTVNVRIAEYV